MARVKISEKGNSGMVLVIDFDGTIVEAKWPEIGEMRKNAKIAINALRADGHKIVVNTCRAGEYAENAKSWLTAKGIEFDAFNENLQELIDLYGSDTRKLSGDIYIDDKNLGGIPNDWRTIYQMVKSKEVADFWNNR